MLTRDQWVRWKLDDNPVYRIGVTRRCGVWVDTQLIIYTNENHGINRPSYQRDRMERYLAWYEKYIKKAWGPRARRRRQIN